MRRRVAWSVCLVVGCGGKAPAATEPEVVDESPGGDVSVAAEGPAASEEVHQSPDRHEGRPTEFTAEHEDSDCFEGPSATLFRAEHTGDHLELNGCDWSLSGPARVITVDGRILKGTAEVHDELDASYRVVARGYTPPKTGSVDALVLLAPVRGAQVVALSKEELAAIGEGVTTSFRLPATRGLAPPTAIVAVDVDGDGTADAAVVDACYRVASGTCSATGDLFVRRVVDASWIVPFAYAQ